MEAVGPLIAPPAVSDRYEIFRFLGEGGTKCVYLARDRRLDREVAIGLLKTQQLDSTRRARLYGVTFLAIALLARRVTKRVTTTVASRPTP